MLLALVMAGGVLRTLHSAAAVEIVCGDGTVEAPEVCDDGNLKSGDGCSSACTVEACGNSIVDAYEQCDDGNAAAGDGCNTYCQIEFCGDSIAQPALGEECDDGNGISGDGCTGSCRNESAKSAAPEKDPKESTGPESGDPSDPVPASAPPVAAPSVPQAVMTQAQQSANFLNSDTGADYKQYLSREESLQLETILKKLSSGRRLTREEREWAETLYVKLQEAASAERTRYTDLLKQFISTPISTEIVDEKELEKNRLVDVEVPVAIDELEEAVAIIRRGELQSQVAANLGKLRRQGVDLLGELPEGFTSKLDGAGRPIEVFATLKGLKEAAEKYATTDVPASLAIIRAEAQSLKEALPVFRQEYGLDPADVEPLLEAIETLTGEVTKQEVDRVVGAVNRFLSALERRKVISSADLASLDDRAEHAAATASRLIRDSGRSDLVTVSDVAAFVDGLSESAPSGARPAFENGTAIAQRVELLTFLEQEADIHRLRADLRKDGVTEYDFRYNELRAAISHVGTVNDPETDCDDTMPDALRCTNEYLSDLQDAARNRSFFTRLVGNLQDYFKIDSND